MLVLMLAAQTGFVAGEALQGGLGLDADLRQGEAGMMDTYLRDLGANRKKLMEQAKKDGLILSERLLSGDATGREDLI